MEKSCTWGQPNFACSVFSSTDPAGRQTTNVFGYSFADFLMGRVATFTTAGIVHYNIHTVSTFFFAQDEWKATPRLTPLGFSTAIS